MKKLAIDALHRDYFAKNQFLELEGLLPNDQLPSLQESIISTLHQRSGIVPEHLSSLFKHGRDLWRSNALLKKWATNTQLAAVAADLCDKRTLRLAFDQYIPTTTSPIMLPALKELYHLYLEKKPTLSQSASIQGVVCGLMLCLKEPVSEEDSPPTKLFSTHAGNGIYFSANLPLDFSEIEHRRGGEYLLIVYAEPNAVFIRQEEDPHSGDFKRLGYAYGDKLSDKLNPKVYK